MSKAKATELLKDILKPLYFKIDKKWTVEDDAKVSNLINALEKVSRDKTKSKWKIHLQSDFCNKIIWEIQIVKKRKFT